MHVSLFLLSPLPLSLPPPPPVSPSRLSRALRFCALRVAYSSSRLSASSRSLVTLCTVASATCSSSSAFCARSTARFTSSDLSPFLSIDLSWVSSCSILFVALFRFTFSSCSRSVDSFWICFVTAAAFLLTCIVSAGLVRLNGGGARARPSLVDHRVEPRRHLLLRHVPVDHLGSEAPVAHGHLRVEDVEDLRQPQDKPVIMLERGLLLHTLAVDQTDAVLGC
mmetsp:Transcript_24559/g.72884  ORF Transcript_24559/g.72884 Transcript_24559/m.72884 type:complete len:223 (-) Transcript_24559:2634-3302(-)